MTSAHDDPHGNRRPLADLRRLGRALPAVAKRDDELRRLREQVDQLERAADRRGAGPERWTVPARGAAKALVRDSGLFDAAWYRTQVDLSEADDEACLDHYLTSGAREGLSPHPAFVGDWYVGRLRRAGGYGSLGRIGNAPLLHYLTRGARRQVSPHPAFDAASYVAENPAAAGDPHGALMHFLRTGTGEALEVVDGDYRGTPAPRRRGLQAFLTTARELAEQMRDDRGHTREPRERETFDHEAEERLKDDLRGDVLPAPLPVVSVVLPTKDRAAAVVDAVASVFAQTWTAWQLVLVDDGSRDGTREALAGYLDDPRVTYVRHEEAHGVAAARNSGLAQASGEWVAYLDSDNTWRPDFLEIMMRFLLREGHRVGYAMSRLVGQEGHVLYRGRGFSREALREQNYIDCIVLVHERGLLESTGGFDESLRRNVDWELFIRLADTTDFAFLPVVATEYDLWETRTDRITTEEAHTYRYVVLQRTLLDWSRFDDARDPELTSVVLVATEEAELVASSVLRAIETASGPLDVVLVDCRLDEGEATRLRLLLQDAPAVRHLRMAQQMPMEVPRNVGAAHARGGTLVFLEQGAWCEPGWDRPLVEALETYVAVQPLVLTQGGSVWASGVAFVGQGDTLLVHRGLAGDSPEVRHLRLPDAVANACVAVRADDFRRVEGFDPLYANHLAGGGLSLRLTSDTGRGVACVPESVVALRPPLPALERRPARGEHRLNARRQRRLGVPESSRLPAILAEDGHRLVGILRDDNPSHPPGPLLVRDRLDRPLRWALKIGAPDVPRRESWGDWHFAVALRDALVRLGHEAVVDTHAEWYRPTAHLDDVSLSLRGMHRYEPDPLHTNLLWVISHPDRVTTSELESFDAVYGASTRWCHRVSGRLAEPVEPLLQCTDHHRFHPVPPDPDRRHDVLAVANARGHKGGTRPAIDAALAVGVVPAVYGERWDGLLPQGAWKGEYIPNQELPAVYAAAGVVLNDHWPDMREEGLLSNRLFDLAACDARILSDHLPEVTEVFGDAVATWSRPEQIPGLVRELLEEDEAHRQRRQELGERVRREHTFDARARQLSDRVALVRRRSGATGA